MQNKNINNRPVRKEVINSNESEVQDALYLTTAKNALAEVRRLVKRYCNLYVSIFDEFIKEKKKKFCVRSDASITP